MRLPLILPLLGWVLLVSGPTWGQTWSTGYFNRINGGYPRNASLDGDPTNAPAAAQWQTTDPYGDAVTTNSFGTVVTNGGTSIVYYVTGWTFGLSTTGNQSANFGGYNAIRNTLPGITNPSLYRIFTSPGGAVSFTADFGLIRPGSPGAFTNLDTFGFGFFDRTGTTNLAQIQFVPTPGTDAWYTVKWVGHTTNGSSYKSMTNLAANSLYRLTATFEGTAFSLTMSGLAAQTNSIGVITNYSITSSAAVIRNGAIVNGLTANDFAYLSVDWLLASMNILNPGANYMLATTMGVSSAEIPLPTPTPTPGPTPAGSTFVTWAAGAALNASNLMRYAIGGATGPATGDSVGPTLALTATNLCVVALVRTNDPQLATVGFRTDSLVTPVSWTSNGVTMSPSGDQSGVPTGAQRQIFRSDCGTNARLFMRLQSVLAP